MSVCRFLLACLCLALLLFASVGAVATDHFTFVLPLVWMLFVPVLVLVIGRERTDDGEQLASQRSLIAPRAPPRSLSFI
jgi:hypothetical protein